MNPLIQNQVPYRLATRQRPIGILPYAVRAGRRTRSLAGEEGFDLESPDPKSVARIRPREPRFERAASLSRPPNRGESGAHPEMSQVPIPKNGKSLLPYLGEAILNDLEARTRDRRTRYRLGLCRQQAERHAFP